MGKHEFFRPVDHERHPVEATIGQPQAQEARLDRQTARALVECGYMPLARYLELFPDRQPAGVHS